MRSNPCGLQKGFALVSIHPGLSLNLFRIILAIQHRKIKLVGLVLLEAISQIEISASRKVSCRCW
jgi:hypothetical protein